MWVEEENESFGTLQILEGHRSLVTVRQDAQTGHTVVTCSVLLPLGDVDAGKQAGDKLMSTAIQIERSVK